MTQIQLSDAQAVILFTACARDDGMVFPVQSIQPGCSIRRGKRKARPTVTSEKNEGLGRTCRIED